MENSEALRTVVVDDEQLARDEFVLRIKRSITTSIIGGESMAQAQRRLRARCCISGRAS